MPIFRIRYTTPRTNHAIADEIDLVTESDWDAERTHQWFQQRHPDAAIVGFLTISPESQPVAPADGQA